MRFLLDSSACISLIRGKTSLTDLPPVDACVLSVVTAAELEVGVRKSSRPRDQRTAVDGFLALFTVLPFEMSAVRDYGEIRTDLEARGLTIGPLDLLIAAHARSVGATLVTGNLAEFRRVKGLRLKAWK